MSTELVRRAKALRLCREILGDESREQDMKSLIQALEDQGSHIEGLLRQEETLKLALNPDTNLVLLHQRPRINSTTRKMRVFEKRFVVESPCLVEGSNAFERKKLAFEVHSRSSKSIFIDLDLTGSVWESDLDHLEDCTLFIPYLENLDGSQQERLERLLNQAERPLVIAATGKTYGELKASEGISSGLLFALSQAHFRLQRPLKEYLELGFFKLFLESLS